MLTTFGAWLHICFYSFKNVEYYDSSHLSYSARWFLLVILVCLIYLVYTSAHMPFGYAVLLYLFICRLGIYWLVKMVKLSKHTLEWQDAYLIPVIDNVQ